MNQKMIQEQQQTRQSRMLEKANFLVAHGRVRRSECKESRNYWMISSYSTPKRWYLVRWIDEADTFFALVRRSSTLQIISAFM